GKEPEIQASSGSQLWTEPQCGQRKGKVIRRLERMTDSAVRPVETGRRVRGHLIKICVTRTPHYAGDTRNLPRDSILLRILESSANYQPCGKPSGGRRPLLPAVRWQRPRGVGYLESNLGHVQAAVVVPTFAAARFWYTRSHGPWRTATEDRSWPTSLTPLETI